MIIDILESEFNHNGEQIFWEGSSKISIIPTKLMELYESYGFKKVKKDTDNYIWVNVHDNIIRQVDRVVLIDFIRTYLKHFGRANVIDKIFNKPRLVAKMLDWLKLAELDIQRDTKDTVYIYFQNGFVQISKDGFDFKSYTELKKPIWESSILERDFDPDANADGDYRKSCFKMSDQDDDRFKCFQSLTGYLLSTYKDPTNPKLIFLTDKNAKISTQANGGSGKSLHVTALGKMRKVATLDGKRIKARFSSWYFWQPVKTDTNIINIEDYDKKFPLENLYPTLTNGIEIEHKGKAALSLPYSESPKMVATSNVGPTVVEGGSTKRRLYEFEFSDWYSHYNSPIDEFEKRFFEDWDAAEWNKFDRFMIECVETFLNDGLVQPDYFSYGDKEIISETGSQFLEFADSCFVSGYRDDKSVILEVLKSKYPSYKNLSSHRFTKFINCWSKYREIPVEHHPSNSKYYLIVGEPTNDVEVILDEQLAATV